MENEKLNKVIKSLYDSLNDEQKERIKACKSVDEITKFAAEEGLELPEEILETVSGGKVGEVTTVQTIGPLYKREPKTAPDPVSEPAAKKFSLFGWC